MIKFTDKDRLNWLQSGHGVVALSKPDGSTVFTANFEEQDWDEHSDVRVAIDSAMGRPEINQPSILPTDIWTTCPRCKSYSQVWVNQDTKKLTCHRWGCDNLEINE